MGSWHYERFGLRVETRDLVLAQQFMECAGMRFKTANGTDTAWVQYNEGPSGAVLKEQWPLLVGECQGLEPEQYHSVLKKLFREVEVYYATEEGNSVNDYYCRRETHLIADKKISGICTYCEGDSTVGEDGISAYVVLKKEIEVAAKKQNIPISWNIDGTFPSDDNEPFSDLCYEILRERLKTIATKQTEEKYIPKEPNKNLVEKILSKAEKSGAVLLALRIKEAFSMPMSQQEKADLKRLDVRNHEEESRLLLERKVLNYLGQGAILFPILIGEAFPDEQKDAVMATLKRLEARGSVVKKDPGPHYALPDEVVPYDMPFSLSIAAEEDMDDEDFEDLEFDEETLEKLQELEGSLGALTQRFSVVTSKSESSAIEGTKFDLVRWTFSKGNVFKGKGWTVPIPDGFKIVEPEDEGHPLRAIPVDCDEDEEHSRVVIIGGHTSAPMLSHDEWMCHKNTREGLAVGFAIRMAERLEEQTGSCGDISTFSYDNLCGFIQKIHTTIVYTENCIFIMNPTTTLYIRVNTCYTTAEHSKALDQSFLKFLSMTTIGKNVAPIPTKFESGELQKNILAGKLSGLDEAIEEAKQHYNISINCSRELLQYRYENDFFDHEDCNDQIKSDMEKAMEIAAFFYEKADGLVEKMKSAKASASILSKVYEKLSALQEDIITEVLGLDNEAVRISMHKRIADIQKKWSANIQPQQSSQSNSAVNSQKREQERELERKFERIQKELEKIDSDMRSARRALDEARSGRKAAERAYEDSSRKIRSLISGSINIYYDDVVSKVFEIVETAQSSARKLNNTCGSLLERLNSRCKPCLDVGMEPSLIREIADEMEELNESSTISIDFSGAFGDIDLGPMAEIRYTPSQAAKNSEEYWHSRARSARSVDHEEELLRKYGVSQKDYQHHCKYIAAIAELKNGTSSEQIRKSKKIFEEFGSYLASESYVVECDERIQVLLAQEEVQRAYQAEYNNWLGRKKQIEKQREDLVKKELGAYSEQLEQEIEEWYQRENHSLNQQERLNREKKTEAEKNLASLGMLKFMAKSACKKEIEQLDRALSGIDAEKEKLKASYEAKKREAIQKVSEREPSVRADIEKRNPIPAEPKKPK